MARTTEGAGLTESHRVAQAYLAASIVAQVRDLFLDHLNMADLDGSTREFIHKALPLIMAQRGVSQRLAEEYLRRFRDVELRALADHEDLRDMADVDLVEAERWADPEDIELGDLEDYLDTPAEVTVDLYTSTANVAKAEKARGRSDAEAGQRAADAVSAQAMKQVSDGARAPVRREADHGNHGAGGWFRVVDADPCPFCAMLAARGPVYNQRSFADSTSLFSGDGEFKVHPGCGCSLEPIYGRNGAGLPETSRELSDEWSRIASGRNDPWNTWRRYKRSGTVPPEYDGDEASPSAPQGGRSRNREKRKVSGTSSRKPIDQLDREELIRAVNAMDRRRKGMRTELAKLEARGVSRDHPGPAQSIATRLNRLDKQIARGNERLGILGVT